MKKFTLFITLFMLSGMVCFAGPVEKQAEKLLEAMDMENLLQQSLEKTLDLQIKQDPSQKPYREVMLKFFRKHMSYKVLKPDLIKIFAQSFTADELKKIVEFYKTPVGKKTVRLMPEMMMKGGELGAKRVQENIVELQQMIHAERNRLMNK